MNVAIITGMFLAFFIAVEKAGAHFQLRPDTTRQIVHITSGLITAFLPLLISFQEIVALGLIFLPVMFFSKRRNVFVAIHGVERITYGEVYFPLAAAATAFFFPALMPYMYGILIMGVSDGVASVVGQEISGRHFKLLSFSSMKSYVGSTAFFFVTATIGIILLSACNLQIQDAMVFALASAGVLTLTEAVLGGGLDNLVLPLAAGLLFTLGTSCIG